MNKAISLKGEILVPIFVRLCLSQCKIVFSFRGLCPLTPTRDFAPGPRWGHSPQTPNIGSHSRARHNRRTNPNYAATGLIKQVLSK